MRSNISALPESELVNLIKQRNLKGLEILYDQHAPALYGIILTCTADKQIAIAILQATFIKTWENFDTYDPNKIRLFTWVYNIACSVAKDYNIILTNYISKRLNCTVCQKK